MTSTFIFTRNRIAGRWIALDPAWRWACLVFAVMRVWLTLWSLVILFIAPRLVQNLDLFGAPVLAAFDLASSEREVYSRVLDGQTLTFRAAEHGFVMDTQTGSVWSLSEGRALTGPLAGRTLKLSTYSVEDVFPYRGATIDPNPLLALWQRFDTNWYLRIAADGYSAEESSTAFFPFYPALIHVFGSVLLGQNVLAALLISNIALVGALYFLHKMTCDLFGEGSARRTLVYFAIFPTALFLFAGYTESLFLLLALASLYAGRSGRWWWAAVLGAFAALTRLQGLLLIVPLAYLWWKASNEMTIQGRRTGIALLLIPLATAVFLDATRFSLASSLVSQWQARFVLPTETIFETLKQLASGRGSIVDTVDFTLALLFGAMLFAVWKKCPREYFLFALVMFILPFFRMTPLRPLASVTRYMLPIFPVFMLWGAWGQNAWMNRAIVYLSFPLNLYLSAQFLMWGWVG